MTGAERGWLLLCSHLGDPDRRCLTTAQARKLLQRMRGLTLSGDRNRELTPKDLTPLGYTPQEAIHIVSLLSEEARLNHYLHRSRKYGCIPLTRVSPGYPRQLLDNLGEDAPGVLWLRGDASLLGRDTISLVGSRDLLQENAAFALEAGLQAAKQGLVLVSGNARGADRTGQDACLSAGGGVISVLADSLTHHVPPAGVLYLSEDSFDLDFSSLRALSRNRLIHSFSPATLVAQSSLKKGGTWDGSVKNLRFGWSSLLCFDDRRESTRLLEEMGALTMGMEDLRNLRNLPAPVSKLF